MEGSSTEELARLQRKARREERRERQRRENVTRAAKMHAARLGDATERAPKSSVAGEFNVGCSGWFYWHWKDLFYPSTIATNKWFEYYAARFRTVELNAPFYSWPTVGTVQSWLRQIGRRRFVYTVKVCELITHTKRFKGTRELIRDFGYIADLLGPRMGCFLYQLPPSFHYTAARLRSVLSQLDHGRRNVVEFRHRSWWRQNVYAAFRETGTIFCSCSAPRLPDTLVKTADEIYIRFHGKQRWYRHNYEKAELAEWVQRVRDSGASRVWAYFNNDREGYAISNAREFLRQLKSRK
ncbi:MAG TPA: DUF72 domain-containing protein [Verrucomicrobiae bacterium]|nr:DUF72 domain-containing protein [Verrucomicrobiae bacterium]